MKIKVLFALLAMAAVLASCNDHVYAPALYHQDIAYQPKPASFDEFKSESYVSGGLGISTNPNLNDELISGQFNISHAETFQNVNVAYGAFGVVGDYGNETLDKGDPYYFQDKFFGALGARASANFYTTTGNVDYRIIGAEIAYSHEFGSYADFRQNVSNVPGFYTDTRRDLLTAGLTSEIIWRARNPHIKHGVRGFVGHTFGYNNIYDTYYTDHSFRSDFQHNIFFKGSYFIQFNRFIASIDAGSGVLFRVGYSF